MSALLYPDAFHALQSPWSIALEALRIGESAPGADGRFTFCDLGCGAGLTVAILAAACPDAHFIGVDLDQQQIANARARADATGLRNVEYHAAAFGEVPALGLPACDFVSAHGVLCWIPDAAIDELFAAADALLRPEGLFQVTCNLAAGWSQIAPLRALMASAVAAMQGDAGERLDQVIALAERLALGDTRYAGLSPRAAELIGRWDGQPPAYVAHEYLAGAWRPFAMSEVLARFRAAGYACCGPLRARQPAVAKRLRTLAPGVDDPDVLEDVIALADAEFFRRIVFKRARDGGLADGALTLPGDAIFGRLAPGSLADDLPAPLVDRLGPQARALLGGPLQGGAVALNPTLAGEDRERLMGLVGMGLRARALHRYAAPPVPAAVAPGAPIKLCSALSEILLATPDLPAYGCTLPSPVAGTGLALPPGIALLLWAHAGGGPDDVVARAAARRAALPPARRFALQHLREARPEDDPAAQADAYARDWLPFLARMGVVVAAP